MIDTKVIEEIRSLEAAQQKLKDEAAAAARRDYTLAKKAGEKLVEDSKFAAREKLKESVKSAASAAEEGTKSLLLDAKDKAGETMTKAQAHMDEACELIMNALKAQ